MNRAPKKKLVVALKAGDHVLLGGTRASYPWEWQFGTVLWADGRDVLLDLSASNNQNWRDVRPIEDVRAVGDYSELSAIRKRCADEVRDLQKVVDEATSALGRARDGLFARLDELATFHPFVPPDFEAIDAAHARNRAAIEAAEGEAV